MVLILCVLQPSSFVISALAVLSSSSEKETKVRKPSSLITCFAILRPIPEEPPVMKTCFPLKLLILQYEFRPTDFTNRYKKPSEMAKPTPQLIDSISKEA
ncbi:hypothetical protein AMTR_s00061p00142330 [Amborella trichopoda]|uniref:Secreted protein n=1 Tax=Amborella trichopoda TaxID=13333 RepID=U5DFC7_AMBTC|nr:hypothetical protein AMTR_s00061p00142330 [Amborella trichopoda]